MRGGPPGCSIEGSGIVGIGGGRLEYMQWLGVQRPGLSSWASRAARSRQTRAEEAYEPSSALPSRHCAKGTLWPCCPALSVRYGSPRLDELGGRAWLGVSLGRELLRLAAGQVEGDRQGAAVGRDGLEGVLHLQ
eukprot:scaffold73705_cov60-Phaeocystis_antarctica.AAC.3